MVRPGVASDYNIEALQSQVEQMRDPFSQDNTRPLQYVVVLLMSQHFRLAIELVGSLEGLEDHAAHLAIACNHLKVSVGHVAATVQAVKQSKYNLVPLSMCIFAHSDHCNSSEWLAAACIR